MRNPQSHLVSEPAAPSSGFIRVDIVELAVIACCSQSPILSVEQLAAATQITARTIERRCESAGVQARNVVGFALCARAIVSLSEDEWDPQLLFPDKDPRTAQKLCRVGGLLCASCPTLADFIGRQQFLPSPVMKQRLQERLSKVDGFLVA